MSLDVDGGRSFLTAFASFSSTTTISLWWRAWRGARAWSGSGCTATASRTPTGSPPARSCASCGCRRTSSPTSAPSGTRCTCRSSPSLGTPFKGANQINRARAPLPHPPRCLLALPQGGSDALALRLVALFILELTFRPPCLFLPNHTQARGPLPPLLLQLTFLQLRPVQRLPRLKRQRRRLALRPPRRAAVGMAVSRGGGWQPYPVRRRRRWQLRLLECAEGGAKLGA